MINNFLNQQAQILEGLDANILFALKDVFANYVEETGEDFIEENEIKADAIITEAIKNRMDEMIKAEKKLKNLCESEDEAEEEYEYFEEAKEIQKKYGDIFNGRTLTSDQMECMKRVAEQIRDLHSFETSIDIIKTTEDLMADGKFSLTVGEDLIFKNYLAICEILNEIIEKDWINIDEFEIAKEEDTPAEDFLLNYINANKENNLEPDVEDIKWLTQYGFKDTYVREMFDDKDNYYIILVDGNENRLTDCYCLY